MSLVEGPSICVSDRSGDIHAGTSQGVYFRDTRCLSELRVDLNGEEPEPLACAADAPFEATFVSRTMPPAGSSDSTLVLIRRRYVGQGLREDLVVRNLAEEAAYCQVRVCVDADLGDLRQVKAGRVAPRDDRSVHVDDRSLVYESGRGNQRRGVRLELSGEPEIEPGCITYEAIVPARGEWRAVLVAVPIVEGEELEPRFARDEDIEQSAPAERLDRWRRSAPVVEADPAWFVTVMNRGVEDLATLRVFDPEYPERAVVAAGAPWSMSLYGRDSLLTAWMSLIVDPELALGVLETLARFQGADVDPRTEEEPGRILHELRFGAATLAGDGRISYGSADATPLFVMLLGELRRWGLAPEVVERLLPHADRALAWIEGFGDHDGDGYVEYQRATDRGRLHQGWRDSPQAVRAADGRQAPPPIALAEVQGYVYAAYLARAHFAREAGDVEVAERWRAKAATLKENFNRDFWLEDRGWLAMALDRDKRPLDALTSTMGHCLWTGILDEDKADQVAKHLESPELFSGWGVRTLATSMIGYNPIGYHVGSVWPHDNAIVASGLMRYGYVEVAQRIISAQLDAAVALGGRLPELFSGLDRSELAVPVTFPTSCSPQAWSSAAPMSFLRTMLRLDPWIPQGKLWLAPALPAPFRRLRVERIPLLGSRITVTVDGDDVEVEGLPPGVELISAPRAPLTAE
jgi:glycogen debranching enzyme